MLTLGIHCGHDASASLVKEGVLIVSIREEQIIKIKHYNGFPRLAIEQIFRQTEYDEEDIEAICFSTSSLMYDDLDAMVVWISDNGEIKSNFVSGCSNEKLFDALLVSYGEFYDRTNLGKENIEYFRYILGAGIPVFFVEHHICHAACAFAFEDAPNLIITADGRGNGKAGVVFELNKKSNLKALNVLPEHRSFGALYQCATEVCGFLGIDSEYKIMGVAAEGKCSVQWLERILKIEKTNGFAWSWSPYRDLYPSRSPNNALNGLIPPEWMLQMCKELKFEDFCATIQSIFECLFVEWIRPFLYSGAKIVVAGGCFLNAKMNQRLKNSYPNVRFSFFPDAGDSGLSIGAAVFVSNGFIVRAGKSKFNVFSGLESGEINKKILKEKNIEVRKFDISCLIDELMSGKVIGICEGCSEIGPRALGHRSMVSSAFDPMVKERLNARKGREGFVPVSPSMTSSFANKFLKMDSRFLFMNETTNVDQELMGVIPGVVHYDRTIRPQVVEGISNNVIGRMLSEVERRTGYGVVVNTSLNVSGNPTCGFFSESFEYLEKGVIDIVTDGNEIFVKSEN